MSASSSSESIAITGAGLVCALGLNKEDAWRAVMRGACGIRPLTALEQTDESNPTGGEALLPQSDARCCAREIGVLRRALREAVSEAGLSANVSAVPVHRRAVVLGTTLAGMRSAGDFLRTDDPAHLRRFTAGSVLRRALGEFPSAGFSATTCAACASGLASVALGVTLLESGESDLVIAGGYDPISEYAYAGFYSLRLIAAGPPRPFSRTRDGMKLGEGAGVIVLERARDAAARGVQPLALIRGFGETSDAHHLTQPDPEGAGAARAIDAALRMARLTADEIDMISAHATATPNNDGAEFAAYRRSFGERLSAIPVAAFKSHVGHALGGAGTVELILSLLALRDQIVPPAANVSSTEIEFGGLRLATGTAESHRLQRVLNVSMGFGGANACVILEKPAAAAPVPVFSRSRPARDVVVTGVGMVAPGMIGNDQALRCFTTSSAPPIDRDAGPLDEQSIEHLITARRARRFSAYVKYMLAATTIALDDAGATDVEAFAADSCAILGTTHGAVDYSAQYYREIVERGIGAANPMLFAEGVPNVASAQLSLMLGLRGGAQTIVGTRTAGLEALHLAAQRIRAGAWDRAIVGAAEEFHPLIRRAWRTNLKVKDDESFPLGSGAAVLILEDRATALEAGRPARGVIQSSGGARGWRAEPRSIINAIGALLADHGAEHLSVGAPRRTWLERIEAAAIGRFAPHAAVHSMAQHLAETFSVSPLASIAAALLEARRIDGRRADSLIPRAVLGLDFAGGVSMVKLEICQP